METSGAGDAPRRAMTLAFGGLLLTFWPTLLSFPDTWLPFREHGFVVAALIGWLIWRDRRRLTENAGYGLVDLIPVLLLGSGVWALARIMDVQIIHQFLFVVIMALWALAVAGWGVLGRVVAITLTAMLALPIIDETVPILQRMTTIASGGVARLFGIEATIGYDTVTIESGTFWVAEGCAGLNFLMVGLSLGAVYAHLFARRWQTKLLIVGLAGAGAIVANWLRVAFLIFVGAASQMQSDLLYDHMWEGWAIFTALMVPAYFIVRRVEDWDRRGSVGDGATEVGRVDDHADADLAHADATAASERRSRASDDHRRVRLVLAATLMAAVGPMLFTIFGLLPRSGELDRDPAIFGADATWSAVDPTTVWTPDYQGIDERSAWSIVVDGIPLDASRLYYVDQRPGEELIQGGNRLAAADRVAADHTIGPVGEGRRLVREAIVRTDDTPRVVWYWYRVGGFETPFGIKAKLLEVVAFFRRSPAAELIVVTAPCGTEDCLSAAVALRDGLGGPPLAIEGGA